MTGFRERLFPPINDVTTDTRNPPPFVYSLPLRAGTRNSGLYGGERTASLQRRLYPRIAPTEIPLPPAGAYEAARSAALRLGWKIVREDRDGGIFEATDTTPVFRFVDDITIRITPSVTGSRIDARSAARLGSYDLGKNAKRLEAFLALLKNP